MTEEKTERIIPETLRSRLLRNLAEAAEYSMRPGEPFTRYFEILQALRSAADRLDRTEEIVGIAKRCLIDDGDPWGTKFDGEAIRELIEALSDMKRS